MARLAWSAVFWTRRKVSVLIVGLTLVGIPATALATAPPVGALSQILAAATPTLTTTASPRVTIGGALHDTAHLAGGNSPTGTITFKLYGPLDFNCTKPPASTTMATVNGNGDYDSPPFTPTVVGTYAFTAAYSGDVNNTAVGPTSCFDLAETTFVDKARPTLDTTASPSVALGGKVHDTAVLAGGFNPTGGITFTLYGPNTCSGPPVFTSAAVLVNGNGSYVSPDFTPTAAGTYNWRAVYPGDANNTSVPITGCPVATEQVEVMRRTPLGDFNGNGKSDIAVFRPSTSVWYTEAAAIAFGDSGDIAAPADFDGDRIADQAVFRPATGVWYIANSGGGLTGVAFGTAGDVPVPADYDGDSRADVAVFRPSTGIWYVVKSTGGVTSVAWGGTGDQAAPADYDGDGKADIAVFRPSTGVWYVVNSGGGTTVVAFGGAGDQAAPADYDGDGKADIANFRPSNGTWYILKSSGATTVTNFGFNGDRPVPGDYDGDGRYDLALFRSSTGVFFIMKSSGGTTATPFGISTDVAVLQPPALRP